MRYHKYKWADSYWANYWVVGVVAVVVVGNILYKEIVRDRKYDEQTARLEVHCAYKGSRIETGLGGGTVEMWDCEGAHFERFAR